MLWFPAMPAHILPSLRSFHGYTSWEPLEFLLSGQWRIASMRAYAVTRGRHRSGQNCPDGGAALGSICQLSPSSPPFE